MPLRSRALLQGRLKIRVLSNLKLINLMQFCIGRQKNKDTVIQYETLCMSVRTVHRQIQ